MSFVRAAALAAFGATLVAVLPTERASAAEWSQPTRSDTLRYEVRAGHALLVSLPPRVGTSEASYSVVSAPAMSWLVDRSFLWQTIPAERGVMPIVFRRTPGGDDLVLMVEVTE